MGLFSWIRRKLDLDDDNFNPLMPWGTCEAILCWHAGMQVTCGTQTNIKNYGYWVCSKHPVPAGTPVKAARVKPSWATK